MTTIPGAFAERCLWTLDDTANFDSLATDASSNADGNSGRGFQVSTGITTQISSLVSFAFNNIERSREPDVPFLDASLDNKAIVLACTQPQGAHIIDNVIKQVAFQQGADVLVLDALDLARGRFGVLGQGAEVIDKLYTAVQYVYKSEDSEKKEKVDTPAVVPLNEDVLRFLDALFATTAPNCSKEPNRRIIYLRNFQSISKVAKPLMTHLLHSLYTPSKGDSYPPEPYPAPPSNRSSVLVFCTNTTSSLAIGAKPSSVEKDCLFLSALFSDARSSALGKSSTPRRRSSWKRYMMGRFMDSDSDDPESEEGWSLGTVELDPIPFNAEMGKKVDELAIGSLKASVFAANVKEKTEEEGWQKDSRAEQIQSMNKALLCACLEGPERYPDACIEDIEGVSACNDVPSKELLSVQAAKSIIYPALGMMATTTPADEAQNALKECLEKSCKAYHQRKEERAEWTKGVDSTQAKGKLDKETDPKSSGSIEKLIKDVSFHARELKGCIIDVESIETTFSNVFVEPAIVESLQTIVSLPLLYPSYFKSGVLASEAIGGILLYGPPGTGKTMLCRALAKTSKARMIHIKPSDINDKYVGESEKKVAAVFELAYKLAPCIVFVDEIDALFSSRNCSTRSWERNILTEFMQGMDGLGSAKKNRDNNIVVVGATNRPFDLDLAILRRIPRRILVDMPNIEMRKGILGFYLKNEEVEEGVSVERLAIETEGFSGSDLKNLCVAAALASVKEAIGPKWNDDPSPPTPPKTPTNDTDRKVMEAQESSKEGEEEESKNDSTDLPVRKISSANFNQARNEIVKSNAGGRLDELYKWHSDHSTSPVSGRKPVVGGYAGGSGVGAGGYGAGTFGARYGAGGYGASGYGAGYTGGIGSAGNSGGVSGAGGGGFGLGNPGVGGFGLGGLGTVGLGADTDFRLPLSRLNQTKPY